MRCWILCNIFRRALRDDLPAAMATFGPEIDNPVRRFDHVQIVHTRTFQNLHAESHVAPNQYHLGFAQRLGVVEHILRQFVFADIQQQAAAGIQGANLGRRYACAVLHAVEPIRMEAMIQATEQLRQERLARMAKAREERVTQMTAQITERYKQQDANGDGLLSKNEVSDRTQQRFSQVDKNGDGYLDASEQQAMIEAFTQRASEGGGGRPGGGGGDRWQALSRLAKLTLQTRGHRRAAGVAGDEPGKRRPADDRARG